MPGMDGLAAIRELSVSGPRVLVLVLTTFDTDVLPALEAGGATNRQAAAELFISAAGVKTHLLHANAKLDVRDRAAAVAEAFRRGLLGG